MTIRRANSIFGFALIETLVYLGLFAIIIGGGMVATYQIMSSSDAINNKAVVEQEGNFLLRKIDWALTGLCQINTPTKAVPPLTSSTDVILSVDKTPYVLNSSLVFKLDPAAPCPKCVQLQRGSSTEQALTSSRVNVSSLNFTRLSIPNQPEAVIASFTINGVPDTFTTTKYLRKQTACP